MRGWWLSCRVSRSLDVPDELFLLLLVLAGREGPGILRLLEVDELLADRNAHRRARRLAAAGGEREAGEDRGRYRSCMHGSSPGLLRALGPRSVISQCSPASSP